MRNNPKKGFTLVELLVVIAILAILSTVAVVGYTSYIESTNITVDENLAAQLNRFLEAYKVDFTDDIDENNIREVTLAILKEGGLEGQLIAKSKDRDFYFDLEKGEYVLLEDTASGVKTAGYKVMFGLDALAADGSKYEIKLENCFTPENKYFYVGSTSENAPISLIIDAFYNFNSANYKDLASKVANVSIPALNTFVNNAVVVTDECNYRLGENQANVIFAHGVNMVGTTTKAWNGNDWVPVDVDSSYTLATLTGKLTIPASVKFFAEDSLNLGAAGTIVINKPVTDVAYMSNANFANSNVTLDLTDGTYYTNDAGKLPANTGMAVITDNVTTPTVELPLQYRNEAVDFNVEAIVQTNKVVNFSTTIEENETTITIPSVYVAWDTDGFYLTGVKFVGGDETIPATHTALTWRVTSNGSYVNLEGDKITFKDVDPTTLGTNPITLEATLDNGKGTPKQINIYPVYYTAVDVELDGKDIADRTLIANEVLTRDDNGNVTARKNEFIFSWGTDDFENGASATYNYATLPSGIKLDDTINVTLGTTGVFTHADNKLTVVSSTATLRETEVTVTVGNISKTINLDLFDVLSLPFQTKDIEITTLGNSNAIMLGDLFTFDGTFPTNAKVIIYSNVYSNDSFADMSTRQNGKARPYTEGETELSVLANEIPITQENWEEQTIQFYNTDDSVCVTIVADGVRIAPDVEVKVVNGNNVRNWTEFKTFGVAGTVLSFADGIVLLGDIDVESNYRLPVSFTADANLYGNHKTFNLKGYADTITGRGHIVLNNASMYDTRVIGNIFPDIQVYSASKYGNNAVHANGTVTIENCYIANTRAPLGIGDEDIKDENDKTIPPSVTVRNCVLFGGRYANIDIRVGELKLEGDVILVNQPHDDGTVPDDIDNVVGVGIGVWFEAMRYTDISKTKIDTSKCTNFQQYNFLSKEEADYLPPVTMQMPSAINNVISGFTQIELKLKEMFLTIFDPAKASDYGKYVFKRTVTDEDGNSAEVEYVNSAFISSAFDVTGLIGNGIGGAITGTMTISGKNPNIYVKTDSGSAQSLPVDYAQTSFKTFLGQGTIMNFRKVNIYFTMPIDTYDKMFRFSQIATSKYCPWEATDIVLDEDGYVVMDGEQAKTQVYEAYDFASNGSIIH